MLTPGLLSIDWQQGFRDREYWGARNNPKAEANAAALFEAWRARDWPIYVVRHLSATRGSPFAPESPGAALEPFAMPRPGERLIEKSVNSAFIGTDLEALLRADGVERLVITGATTDHCVSTTARMAANLGFRTTLVGDACFAHEREAADGERIAAELVHRVHLASLAGEFVDLASTDALLGDLE